MLPVSFLRHLISFYGDSLQVVVPRYLEQTMQAFAKNQSGCAIICAAPLMA